MTKKILVGLVCTAMEFLTIVLNAFVFKIPLYMDCIWTVAASFFSPVSGIICGTLYHLPVIFLLDHNMLSLVYILCSLSVVLCVRIFVSYRKKMPFALSLLILIVSMSLLISIEGGIIYSINFGYFEYIEESSANDFIYSFFLRGFSFLMSGILGRIPINLLDKTIACLCGWLIYKGFRRLLHQHHM